MLENIPRDTTYTVREIDSGGYTPSYKNETGVIEWNVVSLATITNKGTNSFKVPNSMTIMPNAGGNGQNMIGLFIVCWSISLLSGFLLKLLIRKEKV